MNDNLLVLVYGLLSAASWGAADFNGGLASKKLNVYWVVALSQIIGLALIFALALLFGEHLPSLELWLRGMITGIVGIFGLLGLYYSLSTGQMNVAAPVTAIVAAGLPVIFSIYEEGPPDGARSVGFLLGLLSIWFLASGDSARFEWRAILIPVLAGSSFGLFFILLRDVSREQTFMPLVSARTGSLSFLGLYLLLRQKGTWGEQWETLRSQPGLWPLLLLSGALDALGNAFYALAAQAGRLDVAAVLSSLYPAATVALALLILKEKLSRGHGMGVVLALMAIVLIAL